MQVDTVEFIICFSIECLTLFFSVIGNFLVCFVLIFNKKLARTSNMYILNMAIANLLVGAVAVPFAILRVSLFEFYI